LKATCLLTKEPEECMYVGDTYNRDIVGAKKAGMQTCWFNRYCLPVSQADNKPDFEIHTLGEILEILDSCDDEANCQ